jgi:hypothetical protein
LRLLPESVRLGYAWQTRDYLSALGAVTPHGKGYTLGRQRSPNGLHTAEFLKHLLGRAGARLPVIWDGSPIRRRAAVKEFLAGKAGRRLGVEALPAYAPDLNDGTCLDREELHLQLHLALGRLRQKPDTVRSSFAGAGLPE